MCVSDPKEPQSTTAMERPPSPANSIAAEGLFSLAAHSGPDHSPLTLTALCSWVCPLLTQAPLARPTAPSVLCVEPDINEREDRLGDEKTQTPFLHCP